MLNIASSTLAVTSTNFAGAAAIGRESTCAMQAQAKKMASAISDKKRQLMRVEEL